MPRNGRPRRAGWPEVKPPDPAGVAPGRKHPTPSGTGSVGLDEASVDLALWGRCYRNRSKESAGRPKLTFILITLGNVRSTGQRPHQQIDEVRGRAPHR